MQARSLLLGVQIARHIQEAAPIYAPGPAFWAVRLVCASESAAGLDNAIHPGLEPPTVLTLVGFEARRPCAVYCNTGNSLAARTGGVKGYTFGVLAALEYVTRHGEAGACINSILTLIIPRDLFVSTPALWIFFDVESPAGIWRSGVRQAGVTLAAIHCSEASVRATVGRAPV
jgi:hypothetical protein